MKLLFLSGNDRAAAWRAEFAKLAPELGFVQWPHVPDPAAIDFALVWKYKPGELKRYPNLKLVSSLGAGIDHIVGDPDFPAHVPFVRLVDTSLTEGMVEYALYGALRHHRQMRLYEGFRREGRWNPLPAPDTGTCRVGVAGVGEIGGAVARALKGLGFAVAGWSRTGKGPEGLEMHAGPAGWKPFLGRSDILICVLPLTRDTRGILNAEAFAAMPEGSALINIARGGHVVSDDLVQALDSGPLAHALLDVTDPEPPPANHPFWTHPKLEFTPHIASLTNPATAAPQVVANIRAFLAGRPLRNLVDRRQGY
jgi:glyoxylate/hydroxypyruvate reductase A